MKSNHVLLIDGMALLFRSFYATALNNYYMVNSKGVPTNALYGFVKHLLSANNKFSPTHIIVCWDLEGGTFRKEIFSQYKANRTEPPQELIPQFSLAQQLVSSFDIPNVGVPGYEADDCIGTLIENINEEAKVTVVTGDKDLLQLINNNTEVALIDKGIGNYRIYSSDRFFQEYDLSPAQFSDVKALMGDSSDNYSGVRGIGEKTALKLIREYDSLDGVLNNLGKLSISQRSKIEGDLKSLQIGKQLAEIYKEVPIDYDWTNARYKVTKTKVLDMFKYLEFSNLEKYI